MPKELDLPRIAVTDPRFQFQRNLRKKIRRSGGSIRYDGRNTKTWTISTKGKLSAHSKIMDLLREKGLTFTPMTGDEHI